LRQNPCFKIISTLARTRQHSRAISEGESKTIYADQDVLVFERLYGSEVVLVAVNRGDGKTIAIQTGVEIPPGDYTGLLTQTSEANQGNSLTVTREGQETIDLGRLSALVVWSQLPQP
jgi:cyclomaltodextrin glucanotransferase